MSETSHKEGSALCTKGKDELKLLSCASQVAETESSQAGAEETPSSPSGTSLEGIQSPGSKDVHVLTNIDAVSVSSVRNVLWPDIIWSLAPIRMNILSTGDISKLCAGTLAPSWIMTIYIKLISIIQAKPTLQANIHLT